MGEVALYEAGDASQWERVILEYARETAEYGVRLLTAALEEAREDQALEGSFGPAMAQDRQALEALGEAAAAGDWDEAAALQQNYAQARRGRLPAEYKEDPLFSPAGELPERGEKGGGGPWPGLGVSREQGRGELAQAAPLVRGLAELTLDFPGGTRRRSGTGTFWTTATWSTGRWPCSAGRTAAPRTWHRRCPAGSRRS